MILLTQAYGDNLINNGNAWCLFTGDVNQDGIVDVIDLVLIYNDASILSGGQFQRSDLNFDEIADVSDMILGYNNAGMLVSEIAP